MKKYITAGSEIWLLSVILTGILILFNSLFYLLTGGFSFFGLLIRYLLCVYILSMMECMRFIFYEKPKIWDYAITIFCSPILGILYILKKVASHL